MTQGNLYGGGIVFDAGYPTTAGAIDPTYNDVTSAGYSRMDIGLTKFSANGSARLYSTYIGGGSPDQPHSMMVNNAGELVMLGTTGSDDFPIPTSGLISQFQGGPAYGPLMILYLLQLRRGCRYFLLKLNPTGTAITAGTFYGTASANEGLNIGLAKNYGDHARGEVIVDDNDNIFIATTAPAEPILASHRCLLHL